VFVAAIPEQSRARGIARAIAGSAAELWPRRGQSIRQARSRLVCTGMASPQVRRMCIASGCHAALTGGGEVEIQFLSSLPALLGLTGFVVYYILSSVAAD
jgi:hypothetical protein